MNCIKELLRQLVLGEKASSRRYVAFLRKQGVQVGQDVRFFDPVHTHVDVTNPWLLTIGDHVSITRGVTILTHDYAWSVVKGHPDSRGVLLGAQSPVSIGSNVFIGMNAILTRGVTIGDHVIIGAGSVVTGDCESSFVYGGNPARKLMSLQEFREKREKMQEKEAKAVYRSFVARFGREPEMTVFSEYFPLFCTASQAAEHPLFRRQMETGQTFDACVQWMQAHPPRFESYEAFLAFCREEEGLC